MSLLTAKTAGEVITHTDFNAVMEANGWIEGVGLNPIKTAKYIVVPIGSLYYVFDGSSGKKVSSNAAAHVAAQYAFDNLTVGRTWKEKVVFLGAFPLSGGISLPSYVIADLVGAQFTLGTSISDNMFEAVSKQNIDVLGGVLDANKANNSDGGSDDNQNGIYVEASSDMQIEKTKIQNTVRHGVRTRELVAAPFTNCTRVNINYCNLLNCGKNVGGSGMKLGDNDYGEIDYNYISGSFKSGITGNGFTSMSVKRNKILSAGEHGIYFSTFNGADIDENDIYGCWENGVQLAIGSGTIVDAKLRGNKLEYNGRIGAAGYAGMIIHQVGGTIKQLIAQSNIFKNNNNNGAIIDGVDYGTLSDNRFYDDLGTHEQLRSIYGVNTPDYWIITDNYLEGWSGVAALTGVGNNCKILHNPGYVNENSGTATILSGNTSVDVNPGLDASINLTTATLSIHAMGTQVEVRDLICTVKDADEFTITASGATTGDRTVYWTIKEASAF